MNPLKVGIVGCGLIGEKRSKVIRTDPFSRLGCVADIVSSRAESLAKEYRDAKTAVYRYWQDMLDKECPDVIIVATPNKYSREITLAAAQRKIHVLCEKPLGRNSRESLEMFQAAKEHNIVLKTGFNHRHHPAISEAHRLLKKNAIGRLYLIRSIYGHGGRPGYEKEWRANREICGGGELLDQGTHIIDLFRWFLGDFEEAFGYIPTYYWNMEVEDNAFALFKTARGQIASMHTSWTQWKNRFTFEVYGESGYLIIEGLGGSYGPETLRIGKRKVSLEDRRQYVGGAPDEEIVPFSGIDISWEGEWKEIVAAINEKREPIGNGQDGLEANRLIEAVYRSSQENRPIKIEEVK